MPAHFVINGKEIEVTDQRSLFEYAEALDVRVPTSCNKQGKCRECLVEVTEGMECLSPRTPEETHLKGDFRLSCRCHVAAASGTVKCHTMRRGSLRIQESGESLPGIQTLEVNSPVRRDGDQIRLDGEVIDTWTGPLHGLAIDVGTTTVVLRLYDLESGELKAMTSFENPQRFGGSDVMARIRFDSENRGRLLQRTLLGYLSHAIEAFAVPAQSIFESVVVGNSTMRDLFFGLDVYSIGQKPYRSLTEHEMREGRRATTSLAVAAKRLRLPVNPRGRIYGVPLISGHLGADAAACLLAINMDREERPVVLMDIGTNTELLVGNKDKLMAASCPAGPAFEGGVIACGMPGLEGAIEQVRFEADGRLQFRVIGNREPEGICGSGLIMLLSELLRTNRMNVLGRLQDGQDRFIIDPEHNLYLQENDISELAQAKGANVAGLQIALKNYGLAIGDIACFYLAGGFGRHIDLEAARRIGLIPDLPPEKVVQIGNAAIEGASIALLSDRRRHELESRVKTIQHVALETDPDFFNHFTLGCQFTPLDGISMESMA